MNIRAIGTIFWGCLVASATLAGEEHRTRVEIQIDDEAAGSQSFTFDSQDAGFDLDSFVVGETRSVTDVSGNTADIRRTEEGFEIDVNGKTIDLMGLHELDGLHDKHDIEMRKDGADSNTVVVKDIKKVKVIKLQDGDGEFHEHDAHEIHIIEKEVDVTD